MVPVVVLQEKGPSLGCYSGSQSGLYAFRRVQMVLFVSRGSAAEDWRLGADHLDLNTPLATELNSFKQRMEDASKKTREGAKMIGLHMFRLSNYMEALRSRSVKGVMSYSMKSDANSLKSGKQGLRNLGDYESEKLEKKVKIVELGLKKKIYTSMLAALVCRAMASGTSEINKMDLSIQPLKVSSPAALGNDLGTCDPLEDQKTTPDEKIITTGKKHTVHDEQTASSTIKSDNSRMHRTNSTSVEDSSSCRLLSGANVGVLKQPTDENGVSVSGIANNLKRAPSTVLSAHYIANWVAQRPHKIPRAWQANAVFPVTNDEILMPSRAFATSEPRWRSSCNAADILPSGSSFDKNHPIIGKFFGVVCKAEAFTGESRDDMQGQGRIISTIADDNPRVEKVESLTSSKPTKGIRRSSNKDKSKSGSAPPKKVRKCKASVFTGQHLKAKASDITGETDDDHKELLVAAGSVYSARENACSSLFWKTMESLFAPVTSQDLLFLKQQLDHAENQTQSQMFGDECDAVGGITKNCTGREVSSLDQGSVKSTAFGRSNKTFNGGTPLFQRVLSALIDEDGREDTSSSNEGRNISFQCMNDDPCLGSCSYTCCDPHSRDRVEFEVEPKVALQAQKYFPVHGVSCASSNTNSKGSVSSTFSDQEQQHAHDGLSYSNARIFHENDQNNPILTHTSQVNAPPILPFNCAYQTLCLDDELLLELQNIGFNAPLLDDREEWIDREIKELKGVLYQQVAKVKNNLRKIEKAIKCEQDLEKRNLEESAMDQLVEMAYKRMFQGRASKSSRIRKISEQAALAFVKRTLARCKQFEDSGRSCFSQPNLLDINLYKPPSEKDVRPTDCAASMISNDQCKQARDKAKCKCSENGPVLGAIERLDSQIDNLHRGSSGLQQTLTQSGYGIIFNKWKKECLSQIVGDASSKITELMRVTNPSQVHRGVSGAVQALSHPFSHPSGLFSTYDCSSIKGKMKQLGEIVSCSSSKAKFEGRHSGIGGERCVKIRGKKTVAVARSAPQNVSKSKAKSKPKKPLSRIRLEELAHSAKSSALKTSDQIANGNNELPSPANASHDVSSKTGSIKNEQLDALDSIKFFGETEDLCSLLNFDEEGLLDDDCVGLDVPMDDLSEVDVFM